MKLEVAKKYSEEIRNKVSELNQLLSNAALDGISTELTIFQVNTFGQRYYSTIEAEVKISPTDLDD